MAGEEPSKGSADGIEKWEWLLVKELVRQLGSDDPDCLETELLIKLTDVKAKKKRPRSWKNYLWKSLYNHGLNIVQRSIHPKTVPIDHVEAFDSEGNSEFIREVTLPESWTDPDQTLALKRALAEFNPRLQHLWQTLKACNGSQLATAKRLRKHPNTIAYGVAQIRQILKRHGLT